MQACGQSPVIADYLILQIVAENCLACEMDKFRSHLVSLHHPGSHVVSSHTHLVSLHNPCPRTIPGCPAPMPASPSLPCSGAGCCLRCHRSSSSGAVRSRRRCHEGTETPGQSRSAPMEVLACPPWYRSAPMEVAASLPWSAPVSASSRQGAGGRKKRRVDVGETAAVLLQVT